MSSCAPPGPAMPREPWTCSPRPSGCLVPRRDRTTSPRVRRRWPGVLREPFRIVGGSSCARHASRRRPTGATSPVAAVATSRPGGVYCAPAQNVWERLRHARPDAGPCSPNSAGPRIRGLRAPPGV